MRVLILAPPRSRPDRLTLFSFLDEEIRGLADAGVEAYLLTPAADHDELDGEVRQLAVSRQGLWAKRVEALALIARQWQRIPAACFRNPTQCIHRSRFELAIATAVREHRIDCIHSHFGPFLGFGGLLAGAETDVPVVATFRGMDLLVDESIDYGLRQGAFYAASCAALLRSADVTTYASDFMRREGLRLGAEPSRAVTIRKGVALDRFQVAPNRIQSRSDLGVPGPMLLTVAGLIRRKGIDTLLRALGRIRDSHRFTLVVCGKGPEEAALRRLSQELEIDEQVEFRGQVPRDEIAGYFAACDIFILASRGEAAGNVILEAMAAGRPVVTTDSGGPPEYVQDGQTGFVVPVEDDAALASRLRTLLDDPDLAGRLGAAGRKLAVDQHRYQRMIADFIEAYRRAGVDSAGPEGRLTLPLWNQADPSQTAADTQRVGPQERPPRSRQNERP